MKTMKDDFIRLALRCKVLEFGSFTLKSGRVSPYFFNTGLFYQGESLRQLGEFYARTLIHHQVDIQHLFGPAYKGLPLGTATAIALAHRGINPCITFNRKENKNHGESGLLIGAPIQGPLIFIDDVMTAGTAFREAQQLIQAAGGKIAAVIVALDRCEKGLTAHSTLSEIKQQGINVYSIINFFDLITYLKAQNAHQHVQALETYWQQYGCLSHEGKNSCAS